jgi:hypothetical protein
VERKKVERNLELSRSQKVESGEKKEKINFYAQALNDGKMNK